MNKRRAERMVAWLLSVVMLITQFSTPAYAQEPKTEDNLCVHHTEHTADCGYTEGTPCTFTKA